MAFGEITFEFEELPLGECRIDGIKLTLDGEFSGRATINFDREADWWISDVEIAAYCKASSGRETAYCPAVKLSRALDAAIINALQTNDCDRIQESVNREFEGAGYLLRTEPDNGERHFQKARA